MEQIILNKLKSKLLERKSLDSLPNSIWKRTSALNTWGTNAIEGSTITWKDAEKILLEGKTPGGKPVRDVSETIQHEVVFRGLLERSKCPITLETALELHGQVFRLILLDAGHWRRINVRIQGAKFSPPRMEKIIGEMENWLVEYQQRDIKGEDAFSLAAWMHYEFERIHPFSDGNGRIGRLLLNLHFLKRNWPPVHALPAHRDDYLDALNSAAKDDFIPLENLLKILMASSLLDMLDAVGTAQDELISLKKVANLSPYSENYLALRCKQGELPALKSGREWRTSKRALELYIEHIARK